MTYPKTVEEQVKELKHYGVLGMKWGVRKDRQRQDRGHEGEKASARTVKKADKKYEKEFSGSKGFVNIQNNIAGRINPRLESLNRHPNYDGVDMLAKKNKAVYDQYLKDYEKLVDSAIKDYQKSIGTNASGTRQLKIKRYGHGAGSTWEAEMTDLKVKHADSDITILRIKPKFDKNGKIVSQTIELIEDSMRQTDLGDVPVGELAHYGVLGMKWGVRKDRGQKKASAPKKKSGKGGVALDIATAVLDPYAPLRKTRDQAIRTSRKNADQSAKNYAEAREKYKSAKSSDSATKAGRKSARKVLRETRNQYLIDIYNSSQSTSGENFVNGFLDAVGLNPLVYRYRESDR